MGVSKEVHVARRDWLCDAPYGPCARRIPRGTPYTQTSFSPGTEPFKSPTWIVLRACTVCSPVPHEVTATAQPCSAVLDGLQCSLDLDHRGTPHEFPLGLF